MRARSFALRLAILYGAIFLIVGTYTPYFPVWLHWRGFGADEIALVLAAPQIIRLAITPAISFVTDRFANHRQMLILLAWGTAACMVALHWATSFAMVFLVASLMAVFWTTVMPLTETVAMTGVRRAGLDYGRMRLWGSLTFIVASFGGGFIIEAYGSGAALWLLIAAAVALIGAAHVLPRPAHRKQPVAHSIPPIRFKHALALATTPAFLLFLIAASSIQAGHAVYYIFGTLHWQSLGISTGAIGFLWAIGVLAEVALFAVSGAAVMRFGPVGLILMGAAAAILRWTVTAIDPSFALLVAMQLLHGATFGATHLGAIHFIAKAVPEALAGTAQGLYATVSGGVAMGLAMVAAGPLYATLAGKAYLAMSALGLVGLLAGLALALVWQKTLLLAEVE